MDGKERPEDGGAGEQDHQNTPGEGSAVALEALPGTGIEQHGAAAVLAYSEGFVKGQLPEELPREPPRPETLRFPASLSPDEP